MILGVDNENKIWREIHSHGMDTPRISRNCLDFDVTLSPEGAKAMVNSSGELLPPTDGAQPLLDTLVQTLTLHLRSLS